MKSSSSRLVPVLQQVAPPWRALVLVCSKCEGGRHGPSPKEVRKCLKKQLHKSEHVRIAEVECLKVCPDAAVTVCIADDGHAAAEVYLVSSEEDIQLIAKSVRGRGTGDVSE